MRVFRHSAIAVSMWAVVAAAGCSSSNNNTGLGTTVVGSGVLAQQDRAVAGFTGLAHASIGDVYVTLGAAEALRIHAEDNLLEHIETVVQGGTLRIETESGVNIRPTLGIEFHLTVTSLDMIALIGVGDIEFLALDAADLDATLAGVGGITLAGQVTRQTVLISGVGDYEAEQLQSTDADVTISGQGDATVAVSGTLDATISGIGSVFYVGNPVVTSDITGAGTVEPK